jgi:peptidoglycan L-alanyl-D-glutamate endopeptidase CwlK
MGYVLGKKSEAELVGVHPDLVRVVRRAITITQQDFAVHDGLRTEREQEAMLRSGASTTMNSRHLTGHAVDLVPWFNGKLRWEWPLIYPIAEAMRKAGQIEGVPLCWGGAWDILLTETGDQSPQKIVEDYAERRKKAGKKVFIDGPHFELPKSIYP